MKCNYNNHHLFIADFKNLQQPTSNLQEIVAESAESYKGTGETEDSSEDLQHQSDSDEEYEIFKSGPYTKTDYVRKCKSKDGDLKKITVQKMINMARSRRQGLAKRCSSSEV